MSSTTTIQPEIAAARPVAASGIGLGALAFGLFSIMDALIKWLSATYPVPQLVVFNALFALIPIAVLIVRRGGLLQLRTRRLGLHLLRGALGMLGSFLAFFAYSRLPLADAYAIIFATPLLITALSVPILGEAVGWRRWSAVVVGFVGVLINAAAGRGADRRRQHRGARGRLRLRLRHPSGAQAERDRDHDEHRVL
jgi:drug/metabolite transporter (DMT)-like permease